jgi:hypothetical protein
MTSRPSSKRLYREAIELLLSAIYWRGGDGLKTSFSFGRPGAPHHDRRMGVEFSYRQTELVRAVLFVRRHGPPYLRMISLSDVRTSLTNFLSENYWYLVDETFGQSFDCSFAEHVSEAPKQELALALEQSELFRPSQLSTLFPLATVTVERDFDSDTFFVTRPEGLDHRRLPKTVSQRWVKPDQFPPMKDWKGISQVPSAWLGVRSPALLAAKKMRSAILGAFALVLHPNERYLFTGRKTFGGYCILNEGLTTSLGDSHTPPIADDIVLTDADHPWLAILDKKLLSTDKHDRKHLKALEYFYRAWPYGHAERFPVLFMALEALFEAGERDGVTRTVMKGVTALLGDEYAEERLRLLIELRGSVIHGGAPDVYDSRKYGRYWQAYGADPIRDLEQITAACLRKAVFDDVLVEHPYSHADLIAKHMADLA